MAMNTLQASILLVFNDASVVKFEDLVRLTGIPDGILKVVVHSFFGGKHKILKKSGDKKITPADEFTVDKAFTSSSKKIEIKMAAIADDDAKEKADADKDRNRFHVIDSALVRLMKARKTSKVPDLVAETLSQITTFQPKSRDIKNRIDSLIEREYFERDPDNHALLKYLA